MASWPPRASHLARLSDRATNPLHWSGIRGVAQLGISAYALSAFVPLGRLRSLVKSLQLSLPSAGSNHGACGGDDPQARAGHGGGGEPNREPTHATLSRTEGQAWATVLGTSGGAAPGGSARGRGVHARRLPHQPGGRRSADHLRLPRRGQRRPRHPGVPLGPRRGRPAERRRGLGPHRPLGRRRHGSGQRERIDDFVVPNTIDPIVVPNTIDHKRFGEATIDLSALLPDTEDCVTFVSSSPAASS